MRSWSARGDFKVVGKRDLVVSGPGNGDVDIFLGNGDGTFHVNGITSGRNQFQLVTADMNRDGKLDLVGGDGCILLGNGDGTFTSGGCSAYPQSVPLVGDLNGDGHLHLPPRTHSYPPPPTLPVSSGPPHGT